VRIYSSVKFYGWKDVPPRWPEDYDYQETMEQHGDGWEALEFAFYHAKGDIVPGHVFELNDGFLYRADGGYRWVCIGELP
jgi:hypothetical protein